MNIVELLASYDPVDLQYKERFRDSDEWYPGIEDGGDRVFTGRKMKADYMSFIPNRKEAEKILLEPLRCHYSSIHGGKEE